MDIGTLWANKMIGLGAIGLAGGYLTGKTKKNKQTNALLGAGIGAGVGAFLNMRQEEAASEGLSGYGAPAQITAGHMGPGMMAGGTSGGSSIPYVAAGAGPTGARRPRKGSYAYRRIMKHREDLAGYGAIGPARGTRAYRRVTSPMPPYSPVPMPVGSYRPAHTPRAPYRRVRSPMARYRPVPGMHRSSYHRPHASYRTKQYCAQIKQAMDAMMAAMANNQPIHAYPGGPVLSPEQARAKLHRVKQIHAHWCSML